MDVIFTVLRHVVVDDDVDSRDVETAGCDVGGDEDVPLASLELVESAETLGLTHLPVNRDGPETEVARDEGELTRLVARAREDHHRGGGELVEQIVDVAILVLRRHEEIILLQRIHGTVLGAHLHLDRVAQARALKLGHLAGHRGGEELRASLARDHLEDLVNLLLEVEVEQPVRLVEAEHLKLLEAEALGVGEVVNDATGGADDDVRPLAELDGLRHHVDPAHEDPALDADARAERLELLGNLDGELARGREHEGEESLGLVEELLEDGKRERAGLTGARLGETDDVLALQRLRDGLCLNLGWGLPPESRRRGRELVAHAEGGERLDGGRRLLLREHHLRKAVRRIPSGVVRGERCARVFAARKAPPPHYLTSAERDFNARARYRPAGSSGLVVGKGSHNSPIPARENIHMRK